MNKTSPEARRLQMWVLLCAGHLDSPHFLPGVVQLHVYGVDARVVGSNGVTHVSGDPVLLEEKSSKEDSEAKNVYILLKGLI